MHNGNQVEIHPKYRTFKYKGGEHLFFYQGMDTDNPNIALIQVGEKNEYNKFIELSIEKVPMKFVSQIVFNTGPSANIGQNYPDPNLWNTMMNMPASREKR